MNPTSLPERDQIHQLLGRCDERVRQLEQKLKAAKEQWADEAREWTLLQRYRDELAEWLVDQATNISGELTTSPIDAGLRGELFVPCTYTATIRGRRFRLNLVTTDYEVTEIEMSG